MTWSGDRWNCDYMKDKNTFLGNFQRITCPMRWRRLWQDLEALFPWIFSSGNFNLKQWQGDISPTLTGGDNCNCGGGHSSAISHVDCWCLFSSIHSLFLIHSSHHIWSHFDNFSLDTVLQHSLISWTHLQNLKNILLRSTHIFIKYKKFTQNMDFKRLPMHRMPCKGKTTYISFTTI